MVVFGAAAMCLAALLAPLPSGAEDDHEPRAPIVKKRKIAPGVTFTRIIQRQVPLRTFVLRIDPSKPVTLDVSLAAAVLGSRRTVLEIAKAHGALAAVNGDYTVRDAGRPTRPFAQDGELVQSGGRGPMFALARDEGSAFLGAPRLIVAATDRDSGQTWRLDRWNFGPPIPGEIAGFTPRGGTFEAPPSFACSVRLLPDGEISFDEDQTGVVGDYVVDAAACEEGSMTRNGGVVLSAPPATDEATQLLTMMPGTRIRLRWSLGWQGVYDVVGGTPILIRDGEIAEQLCSGSSCIRHPRTGIGYTDNGGVLLVVVDGRQPRWSRGASFREFAVIMQDLGAIQALNLDGGGSTTMVVEGEVVNRPSDGQQRSLSNAVLVLPGPDPGET
jgi:phosphodiester glycosidase